MASGETKFIGYNENVAAILISMALGTIVSSWIGNLISMSFPNYVGAMFVVVIVRNLNEKLNIYKFDLIS